MIGGGPPWWLMQATAAALPESPGWAQYGAGGVAFGALAAVSVYVYKREAARSDRLEREKEQQRVQYEAEIKRLNEEIIRRHVPALEAANNATTQSVQTLQLLLDRVRGPS